MVDGGPGPEPLRGGNEGEGVGRVVGTEDATPLRFHVAIGPDSYLQLDDVVVCDRALPGARTVVISGVVTEVRSRHEGASFGSDVFLISDGVLPAQVQEVAEVTTTRVEPEVYVPPRPGEPVRRARGSERAQALYFDQMTRQVVVGMGRDGAPVYLNLDFLDGTRGAHVSISGVSGVATKTSFALFLLYSLLTGGALGRAAINTKALVFSVKGEDLLFLDQANARLDDGLRAAYAQLGLSAGPFSSVAFFAPPRPGDRNALANVVGRPHGVQAFWWTLVDFCAGELLPFVFADTEDDKAQYVMVVHQVTSQLRRRATPCGTDGAVEIDGSLVSTYDGLVDVIDDRLNDDASRADWAGAATGLGTINAFLRRLRSSTRALRDVIRGDIPQPAPAGSRHERPQLISTAGQQLTVVDLHHLPERAQRFVVGVVLAAETARKEAAGPGSLLLTMIDELNKYAPREGGSPIKDVLLDIAERGRSLGIILIGAQQTASEVERRIISNSSIKVVGRLDPAEASRSEYGFLPPSQRARAVLAKPGTMFVAQPEIPVPLAVEFPFPAWATRQSELAAGALESMRAPDPRGGAEEVGAAGRRGAPLPRGAIFSRLPAVDDDEPPPF